MSKIKGENANTVGEINLNLKPTIVRNIQDLLKKENKTQQDLADALGIAKASLSGYLNDAITTLPPIGFFVALKNLFGINIDDFLTKDGYYDAYTDTSSPSDADIELEIMYRKFVGVYSVYYLDTDSYKGRDHHDANEAVNFGVLYIKERKSSVSRPTYDCIAILGISDRKEIERLRAVFSTPDASEESVNEIREKYSSKLYTGVFEIQENFAYISLRHGTSDRALAIFHCPSTNKSQYTGGIGTINSVSKGREKMPTIQYIGISRKNLDISEEELHQSLLISVPTLKADKYAPELVKLFKSLYVDRDSVEIDQSELQKLITVRANMERYINECIESNLFRCAKVSNEDDNEFYHWIKHTPEMQIDPDLL